MTTQQQKALKSLSKEELVKKLEEINSQLNAFFITPKDKIEKTRQKSNLRHERARIMTFLTKLANT